MLYFGDNYLVHHCKIFMIRRDCRAHSKQNVTDVKFYAMSDSACPAGSVSGVFMVRIVINQAWVM